MRAALITGASTGIGRATALLLDSHGWRVYAGVRKEADASSLQEAGSERLIPVMLDVTDSGQIAEVAARIAAERSGEGLDGLVNNAGVGIPGPLETIPIGDFRRQLEINPIGHLAVTQAVLESIRAARGRIVFVSSIGGQIAFPLGGAYHAGKFAVEAVGDQLRQELRPWGISVSIVEPGSIDTPIWESGLKVADEIAERAPRQRELYGEAMARMAKMIRQLAKRGIPPRKVADAIEHALSAPRPRTRYPVGIDARVQTRVKRVIPDRVWDRIVSRVTGL